MTNTMVKTTIDTPTGPSSSNPGKMELEEILRESSSRHKHLCPRQVLGARMGLLAGELLRLELPNADKRLLVVAETDGCTVDGIIAATGCHVGGRTLRIHDFGKIAATFIDVQMDTAFRISPSPTSRSLALAYVPSSPDRWSAMLEGYKIIPDRELFNVQKVTLTTPVAEIISSPQKKAICEFCGEEIFNGREIVQEQKILCRSCAGEAYYQNGREHAVHS